MNPRVLVTGASRGLGLAICKRLAADGFQILAASRTLSPELSDLARKTSDRLEFIPCDLSDSEAPAQLAQRARLLDGIDAVISNAAVGTEGLLTLAGESEIKSSLQVNLIAPILLAREAVKGMLHRGGNLIFICSVVARSGSSGLSVYAAAKGGLISFSRCLAREYGERGIRSNCVLPGYLETEMSQTLPESDRERLIRRTALGRLGAPEDAAGCVAFLLSTEARFITGTELVVDGGLTA